MNLHHLRHFLAIAEHGSIRAAADSLGVSQPAVSKALQQIERILGVSLVQRGPRGSVLTDFGKVVYVHARLIENEFDRIVVEVDEMAGAAAGRVVMGLSATPSILLLPPAITSFRRDNPEVTLELVGGMPSFLLPRLVQGSLDLVVGPRPLHAVPANVSCLGLLDSPSAIAVRQGHPLEKATSIGDFVDAEWVLNSSAIGIESSLHAAFTKHGLTGPRIVVRADSLPAAYALIAKTDYVGLMPRKVLEDSLLYNALKFVEVPEFSSVDSVEIFLRADVPISPQTSKLVATLRGVAEKLNA